MATETERKWIESDSQSAHSMKMSWAALSPCFFTKPPYVGHVSQCMNSVFHLLWDVGVRHLVTAAEQWSDNQSVDVRVYWGSRAEYFLITEVFCSSVRSSMQLRFCLNLSLNFPVKLSSFFLCSCTQKVFTWRWDYICPVPLSGSVRQPGVSMETWFRGQYIADALCQDVKML